MTLAARALIWIKVKPAVSAQPWPQKGNLWVMIALNDRQVGSQDGAEREAVEVMRRAHTAELALCDRLEEIADSLPNGLDRRKCILAARALGPTMAKIHRFEEQRIFPCFCQRLGHSVESGKTIERLRNEHLEDEGYAAELRDALRFAARQARPTVRKPWDSCCEAISARCAGTSLSSGTMSWHFWRPPVDGLLRYWRVAPACPSRRP
jgi:hypothetical protein